MTNGTVGASRIANGAASASRMTNGTVRSTGGGTTLTLRYKQGTGTGSQTIRLTSGIPIVTFAPGTLAELKPGAHVIVFAHVGPDGRTIADRTLVGRNGLVPPM